MLRNTLKKGDLTFNQIIVAIIAIIVLVVLIVIFSGNIGKQSNTVGSCGIQNSGYCADNQSTCSGIFLPGDYSECGNDQGCCVNPLRGSSD